MDICSHVNLLNPSFAAVFKVRINRQIIIKDTIGKGQMSNIERLDFNLAAVTAPYVSHEPNLYILSQFDLKETEYLISSNYQPNNIM